MASNGLSAVRSSVAEVRERTVRSTRASKAVAELTSFAVDAQYFQNMGMKQLFILMLGLLTMGIPKTQAEVLIAANEVGNNVVFSISGTLDISGLTLGANVGGVAGIAPFTALVASAGLTTQYLGLTGPTSFGEGFNNFDAVSVGSPFTLSGYLGQVYLPRGYTSGFSLSAEISLPNTTFNNLGADITGAPYEWYVPSGDSITLLFSAVPEPRSEPILLLGFGSILLLRRIASKARCGEANSEQSRCSKPGNSALVDNRGSVVPGR